MPRHRLQSPPLPVPRADRARAVRGRRTLSVAAFATAVGALVPVLAIQSATAESAAPAAMPLPTLAVAGCAAPSKSASTVLSAHPSDEHGARAGAHRSSPKHNPSKHPAAAAPGGSADGATPATTVPATVPGLVLPSVVPPNDTGALTDAEMADSVGVNIHPSYTGTTYRKDGSNDVTLQALKRLGITNVRTGISRNPSGSLATFIDGLAANGIKLDGVVGTPDGRWGTYGKGQSTQLAAAVTTGFYRGKVSSLEMPNEWDNNGGSSWSRDLEGFENEYLRTLSTTGVPLIGSSMAHPGAYASFRAAGSSAARNIHPYAGRLLPESAGVIPAWSAASARSSAASTVVATEFGWHNATNTGRGVSEQVSAAYLLRALLWNKTHGVSRSYIYELFDQRPEPALVDREKHWGLVAVTGGSSQSTWVQREKPAYTQLRGMLGFLHDTGSAQGRPIPYTMAGAPSDVYAVPMVRSDGTTDIAIWRRVPVASDGSSAHAPVTLQFGSDVEASAYDTASGAQSTLADQATRSVRLSVGGSVTIVRVGAAG